MEYESTAKWRERRWRLFSTFPFYLFFDSLIDLEQGPKTIPRGARLLPLSPSFLKSFASPAFPLGYAEGYLQVARSLFDTCGLTAVVRYTGLFCYFVALP